VPNGGVVLWPREHGDLSAELMCTRIFDLYSGSLLVCRDGYPTMAAAIFRRRSKRHAGCAVSGYLLGPRRNNAFLPLANPPPYIDPAQTTVYTARRGSATPQPIETPTPLHWITTDLAVCRWRISLTALQIRQRLSALLRRALANYGTWHLHYHTNVLTVPAPLKIPPH
jgi:hypothetical protein